MIIGTYGHDFSASTGKLHFDVLAVASTGWSIALIPEQLAQQYGRPLNEVRHRITRLRRRKGPTARHREWKRFADWLVRS